jgi:hypothetical protein
VSAGSRTITIVLALLVALAGCGIVQRVTGEAARKQARQEAAKASSRALQQKVMRFGDQYMERVVRRTEQLAAAVPGQVRLAVLDWQFTQATAAVQIAAGTNPITNAVDMVVMVSLNRRIVETTWIDRYGEAARPVLRTYRSLEEEAWQLLDGLGTADQRDELEAALARWFAENPGLETAAFIRFADFAGVGSEAEVRVSPGLLGIVGLDPLEGIDPAVREFEQTRLLAERAVYYTQRLPILLDIQLGLIAARVAETPEARTLLETVDAAGKLSTSVAGLTERAPELLSREREAAIAQFMAALEAQQAGMSGLAAEVKGALEAGNLTAQSLDAMVQSTDKLLARFEPAAGAPPSEPSRPFNIEEYTRTLIALSAAARDLQLLVTNIETLTPTVFERLEGVSVRAEGVVDYAFSRVLLAIFAVLVAAVVYRLTTASLGHAGRKVAS